jgi:hypothetical protein
MIPNRGTQKANELHSRLHQPGGQHEQLTRRRILAAAPIAFALGSPLLARWPARAASPQTELPLIRKKPFP